MSRKVLLCCSEEEAVHTLRTALAQLKTEVVECASPEGAEGHLRDERFDAILFDLEGEGVAAGGILQRARNSSLNRNALTIALVGGDADVRAVFALGVNFLIYKPVSDLRARASLRAASALMGRERRRAVRLPIHSKATIDYLSTENGQATLVDLSEEGTAIQSEGKLPPSCKIYFKFELPDSPSVVRLSAEVVWQDSAGRVGMRFLDVPQGSRRVLRQWLATAFGKAQATLASQATSSTDSKSRDGARERGSDGHPDSGLARFRATPGNRRTQSRRACRLGAEVYKEASNIPHRCNLSDISIGGCYVETPSPFPVGNPLEIQVRTRDIKLRVHGIVQSIHPGYGMGVRFELRSPDQKAQLEKLIQQLASLQGLEYGASAGAFDF